MTKVLVVDDSALMRTCQRAGHVGHDLEGRLFIKTRLLDDEVV